MTPTEPRPIILLITVGAQDIKVWLHGKAGIDVDLIPKPDLRDKHRALIEAPEGWTFLTMAEAEDPCVTTGNPYKEAARLANALGISTPVYSPDGRLCISAAKLEPVIEAILAQPEKIRVVGALVFYTERLRNDGSRETEEKDYVSEPIASGPIVGTFLRERLRLSSDCVNVVNCLEGCAGRYEGRLNEHDDFPLRRAIVHRMDSAVREFISRQDDEFASKTTPVTMTTGGIDAFKQVVPAIAELRFASGVRDLSAPETRGADVSQWYALVDERLCAAAPRITRHEAISARGRALDLLRRGEPASAWAAVSRFAGSAPDAWWLRPVELTAAYFGGAGSAVSAQPDRIPRAPNNDSATRGWQQALQEVSLDVDDELEKHKRYALNAAMRVELALQGGDRNSRRYVDALMAVCTMMDAAVIAQAMRFLQMREHSTAIENWIRANGVGRDLFFLKKNGSVPNAQRDHWFGRRVAKTDETLGKRLRKEFSALIAVDDILQAQRGDRSLRALRNSASHRALSSVDIATIADLAEDPSGPLWRPPQPCRIGGHALDFTSGDGRPGPIPTVLKSIGIKDAAASYRRLMEGLESILLTSEPERSP